MCRGRDPTTCRLYASFFDGATSHMDRSLHVYILFSIRFGKFKLGQRFYDEILIWRHARVYRVSPFFTFTIHPSFH